jgi:hypothetical protein
MIEKGGHVMFLLFLIKEKRELAQKIRPLFQFPLQNRSIMFLSIL